MYLQIIKWQLNKSLKQKITSLDTLKNIQIEKTFGPLLLVPDINQFIITLDMLALNNTCQVTAIV